MSHSGSKNALNDYLSELLAVEEGAGTAQTSAPKDATPAKTLPPKAQRSSLSAPSKSGQVAEQIEEAEQEKRKRVQALLNSAAQVSPSLATQTQTLSEAKTPGIEKTTLKQPGAVDPVLKTEIKVRPAPKQKPAALVEPDMSGLADNAADSRDDALIWQKGRPVWAQGRFDVLLFTVSGLTLAVPLIALGQIHRLTDELTPLFGQSDWFMGLMPTPQGQLKTVNTAKFVMPERYDEKFLQQTQFVVSIDNSKWGLAVESVNQPVTLSPDDVKWRDERSKRPWLAGTVKASMCALLDIPQIATMLSEADRSGK